MDILEHTEEVSQEALRAEFKKQVCERRPTSSVPHVLQGAKIVLQSVVRSLRKATPSV